MLVAFSAVALLMISVWPLILVDMSATLVLLIVLLFVCAFLTVLSLFTAVERQDVFFGGAMEVEGLKNIAWVFSLTGQRVLCCFRRVSGQYQEQFVIRDCWSGRTH
jgi:hypothetical protein